MRRPGCHDCPAGAAGQARDASASKRPGPIPALQFLLPRIQPGHAAPRPRGQAGPRRASPSQSTGSGAGQGRGPDARAAADAASRSSTWRMRRCAASAAGPPVASSRWCVWADRSGSAIGLGGFSAQAKPVNHDVRKNSSYSRDIASHSGHRYCAIDVGLLCVAFPNVTIWHSVASQGRTCHLMEGLTWPINSSSTSIANSAEDDDDLVDRTRPARRRAGLRARRSHASRRRTRPPAVAPTPVAGRPATTLAEVIEAGRGAAGP